MGRETVRPPLSRPRFQPVDWRLLSLARLHGSLLLCSPPLPARQMGCNGILIDDVKKRSNSRGKVVTQ